MTVGTFIKSRPLNVGRWSEFPELNNCLGDVAAEIEAQEHRQRSRKAGDAKRFRAALRTLVLDLYVAWWTDPALQIAIPLRSGAFNPGTRYDALFLKYKPFKAAFDGLKKLGYLTVDKPGNFDRTKGKGYRTRVRATPKLIAKLVSGTRLNLPHIGRNPEEEVIILKDTKKQLIDYPDISDTNAMRERLGRINTVLSRHWIDLYLGDDEFKQLNALIAGDPDKPGIDLTAKRLHRVFNEGSFEHGGRFYGGWWQGVPRDYRRLIMINGKPTVEVDYSAIHARLLYALKRLDLPGDPFLKVGFPAEHRQLVKEAFYALVNAGKRGVKEFPEFAAAGLGLSWDQFCQRIMDAHSPIKEYFRSGYGLKLMKMDSDIAEKVMLSFAKRDIPVLPVHDSFLMHHGYEKELQEAMAKAFEEVVGATIELTAKESNIMRVNSPTLEEDSGSYGLEIEELLEAIDSYKGYNERLDAWREVHSFRLRRHRPRLRSQQYAPRPVEVRPLP